MKVLVLGDIHGRLIWYDIIVREQPDKIIFLGDYVSTHDNISAEQQLSNLEDILYFKEETPEKTILLRGNHDLNLLGYSWAECSGFDRKVYRGMQSMKDRFLANTQWIYINGTTIFSHAGISKLWLDLNHLTLDTLNNEPPSKKFGFNPGPNSWDFTGNSPSQPCTWIRPESLSRSRIQGYTQVVGHTPVKHIYDIKTELHIPDSIWLCDALGIEEYLIIEDGEYIVNSFNQNNDECKNQETCTRSSDPTQSTSDGCLF